MKLSKYHCRYAALCLVVRGRHVGGVISLGDSLVLHCASLLRTIFASLARAHKRVRTQNVSDFPQTMLDSEINARFLLNEHGDPHFFFHYFNEDNILHN